jgi:CubicO group peptidase (beta-lactamase class C family)
MRTTLAALPLLVAAMLAPHWARAQPPAAPDRWQPVRDAVAEFLRTTHAGSVSLAVSRGDSVAFAYAAGWADREARRRADTTTRYPIASVTKPLTATAPMRLVDRGGIRLEAPLDRYLVGARIAGRAAPAEGVTVGRVLSHMAGLPEHMHFFVADAGPPPPMAETIRRYGFTAFEPGTTYQYSNLGYGMLGDIVARSTRTSYRTAMQRLVFAPLGMSAEVATAGVRPPRAAVGYDTAGHALPAYGFDHDGASAVHATATDLRRFAGMHLRGGRAGPLLLSDSLTRRMQQRQTPADADGYGMGWELGDADGHRYVGHSGGMPGVRARLWMLPDDDAVVVLLVNGDEWPTAVWERVLNMVSSAPRPSARAGTTGTTGTAAAPTAPTVPPRAAITPMSVRGEWAGAVTILDRVLPIRIHFDSTGARASLGGGALTAVRELTFSGPFVYGLLDAIIKTPDTQSRPGTCWFQLTQAQDGRLTGAVYQGSTDRPFVLYTLAHFAALQRTP